MARSRTLEELAADVYKAADLEGFTDRYPPAEVYRYVNQGIAETWDLLVAARGYAYYGKPFYEMGDVTATGTTPPTVTVSGNPRIGAQTSYVLHIDIVTGGARGTATFRHSTDGGTTWQSTVATAASVVLPGTHLTVTFASGTYNADNLYVSTASKPTTLADTQTYELPTDFYKLHNIWLSDGNYSYLPLEPLAPIDEPGLQVASTSGQGSPCYYQLRDGYFDLLPTPGSEYTINMNYVPVATVLVNTTDSFDGINGYEDHAVAYAAHQMLLKEGDIEMANLASQKVNKMAARIQNMAAERDKGSPMYVQDVRGALSWKRPHSRRYPRP